MSPEQSATHQETQPDTQPASYQVVPPGPHPETHPMPHPVPATTDVAGHGAPVSGPPVATGPEAPVSGPSVSGPSVSGPSVSGPPGAVPTGFPPPAQPLPPPQPAVPGRSAFRILVAAAAVLAAAIAVTATLGWSSVSDLRQGVSDREAEKAKVAQQEQEAARKLADDFRGAGLDTKLQRVKDLDKAADVAFASWRNGTMRLGLLDEAMDACNDAVIAYNNAAGPFPDELLKSLPRRIDVNSPETDCGRAFTGNI